MGGSVSIKGFIYQTIISVISNFEDSDWDYCQVEPEKGDEKTDILFWKGDVPIKAIQVKSSQNYFSATNAKSWLEKMVKGLNGCNEYHLILIGNGEPKLNEYKKNIVIDPEIALKNKGSLLIDLLPYQEKYLRSPLENELRKFYERLGYIIKQEHIEVLTGVILYSFLEFSVIQKKVSRDEFSDMLVNWAKTILPLSFRQVNESDLRVYLYNENNETFNVEEEAKTIKINALQRLINQSNEEIITNFEICKRHIFKPQIAQNNVEKKGNKDFQLANAVFNTLYKSVKISDEIQSALERYISEEFNEVVERSFFSVGNLREAQVLFEYKISGTKEEEEKYYAIYALYRAFTKREQLKDLNNLIEFGRCITLVLKNEGKTFDEDIDVLLEIPSDIEFIEKSDFPNISIHSLMEEFLGAKIISEIFEIKSNHLVDQYQFSPFQFDVMATPRNIGLTFLRDQTDFEDNKRRYNKLLSGFQDFELHKTDTSKILKFSFSKLNPNQTIAFPTRLFLLKNDGDINLKYSIRSKHNCDNSKRELSIRN